MLVVDNVLLLRLFHLLKKKIKKTKDFEKITNRKAVKVIVDSLLEQAVENITRKKPRNNHHGALLLAKWQEKNKDVSPLIDLVEALASVASGASIFEEADYIDYEEKILDFISNPLAAFLQELIAIPGSQHGHDAKRLLEFISGFS